MELFCSQRLYYWELSDVEASAEWILDEELGYHPTLIGEDRSANGTLIHANRPPRAQEAHRVLFIGDSVTHRGRIIEHVSRLCSDPPIQCWNAGVESYTLVQVAGFYERFTRNLDVDQVVLTLHNNDYTAQPIVNFHDDGKVEFRVPGGSEIRQLPHPWLQHSFSVRKWFVHAWREDPARKQIEFSRAEEALIRLKTDLERRGINFFVMVLPPLKPRKEWSKAEQTAHAFSLDLLKRLNISHTDLTRPVLATMEKGYEICERPGDTWHPSSEAAEACAREIVTQQFFQPTAHSSPRPGTVSGFPFLQNGPTVMALAAQH